MDNNNFKKFSALVHKKYGQMAKNELFIVDNAGMVWDKYLEAFPEGTNLTLKERSEHDCVTCRHFVKRIGSLVTIKNGKMDTIWNVKNAPYPYNEVAKELDEFVRSQTINSIFRTKETQYGKFKTVTLSESNHTIVWDHFEGVVQTRHSSQNVGSDKGSYTTAVGVFGRGLRELSLDALNEVIEVVTSDDTAIYRAAEFLPQLKEFRDLKVKFDKLTNRQKALYIWEKTSSPAARFRNSVIGTLIQDMSEGKSLEQAVRSFEAKVAPHNYKRPKALITKGMIDKAMKKIDELGLRDSLERRHATISDVSVNDVLFVDRSAQPLMKDSILDSLMEEVKPKPVDASKAVDISMTDFMGNVVPKVHTIEMLVENRLVRNLMSITAPAHDGEPSLFSWDNDFSWSYNGNLADSGVKERVKAAGGNVTAPFRVSLAWFNTDDLDIHVLQPDGSLIYFGAKKGHLDVDMNAGGRQRRDAVENVSWQKPMDGKYVVYVHNYTMRERIDVGFELEVENNGNVRKFSHPRGVTGRQKVLALTITVKAGIIQSLEMGNNVSEDSASKKHWGLNTQQFVKVRSLMKSPNHWHGEEKGNAHHFFILEDCLNPDPVRGMYNENLRQDLHSDRKVFEILGSKMLCAPSEEQLSGVGFSSTKGENFVVKVHGDLNRVYNVQL